MKKVLILTYYWPPSGGAGVQRWLKFTKYLPELGWTPVVYTPENAEYPAIDEGLLKEVHQDIIELKTPIWEPYSLYKKFTSRKKDAKIATGFTSEKEGVSTTEKLSRWVRGNWFIPDARKFWIKPSIKYLIEYLKENPVDVIVSSGPPHSMHLIANGIKEKLHIPWIADFRDPWTTIDFIDELRLTSRSMKKHQSLEQIVLKNADKLITVGHDMKREYSEFVDSSKIHVIPNGFDSSDFTTSSLPLDEKFTLAHIGSFSPARNIPLFWEVLKELVDEESEFKEYLQIKLVGQLDQSVKAEIEKNNLLEYCHIQSYLPHEEVVKLTSAAQLLLLFVNRTKNAKGILTGKVFEYLKSGRPIFSLGPVDGDLAELLKSVNAFPTIDYEAKSDMKERLKTSFQSYKSDNLCSDYKGIDRYDRKTLSEEFVSMMNVLK